MMKHIQSLILASAVVIIATSCGPTSPAPTPPSATAPRSDATAAVVPTARPTPVETGTLSQIPGPIVAATPAQAATQVFTVAPITPAEPTIGKDKSNVNGVPITPPFDPPVEQVVTQAKQDLAKRLAININQVNLDEVQSVTWPDGSLGCPQPGMAFTQVTVDGLLIRLSAGGKFYEYHSGGSRAPFLCESNP